MVSVPMIAVACSAVFGGAFAANEWSHGGVSESLGMGHHHMMDYGGYHCTSHNGSHAAAHVSHMHGPNGTIPHGGCPGGRTMHGGMTNGSMTPGPGGA